MPTRTGQVKSLVSNSQMHCHPLLMQGNRGSRRNVCLRCCDSHLVLQCDLDVEPLSCFFLAFVVQPVEAPEQNVKKGHTRRENELPHGSYVVNPILKVQVPTVGIRALQMI